MLFNSLEFLVFFPLVVMLYFMLSFKWRMPMLLLASYYFYMCWKPVFAFLMFFTTFISYISSHGVDKSKSIRAKKLWVAFSLVVNLGILFIFKYYNFFNESMRSLATHMNIPYGLPSLDLLLPVGISFYTFQALSYTIDVYRGDQKVEPKFWRFVLFVSFFPQLVAGPIERSTNLLPQFYIKHKFDPTRASYGLKRMMIGFFKKVVVADRISAVVNSVYNNPHEYTGTYLIVATIMFAFQIYCDFSGYTDIAIGAAKVMGFDLMENFKRPYFSKDIVEFWRRWHISLSTWFKDYLYIPLGGSRKGKFRHYQNIMIIFLVSGLWHGASWNFVIWGFLHGIYQVLFLLTSKFRKALSNILNLDKIPIIPNLFRIIITFIAVDFAWIFFRANSFSDAIYIIKNLFVFTTPFEPSKLGITDFSFQVGVGAIILMELIHFFQRSEKSYKIFMKFPLPIRWVAYYGLILVILVFGAFGSGEFIYFQF